MVGLLVEVEGWKAVRVCEVEVMEDVVLLVLAIIALAMA
jgi:hypothetical protein